MRIAVVEDDRRIARLVAEALTEGGHEVATAFDASTGQELIHKHTFDVLILDVMLPGWSGIELCRRLRAAGMRTPILLLTARDAISDRVQGLDAGADDYLVKPFALEELLARVRALSRRSDGYIDGDQLQVGDLIINTARREVRRGSKVIELTAREFALLEFLMRNPGRVLSREQISEHVWGWNEDISSNVVETYVHYLRDKVDHGFSLPLIRTIRGAGYTIKA
ncbi:MAG: response regulator transcription factor [Chloroflexi bacterium]|nr:response regulator transcription factor [Chloroflexota bacterium]